MTWRRLLPLLLLSTSSAASAGPLWEAELRVGYGLAIQSGTAPTTTDTPPTTELGSEPIMQNPAAPAPMTLAAIGAVAVREQPNLSAFGGLIVEQRGDTAVGVTGGVRLYPGNGRIRLTAGGIYLHAPETSWGASASAGTCIRVASMLRTCGDLQFTTYFGGTAIAASETLTQIQAVLGVAFDSL